MNIHKLLPVRVFSGVDSLHTIVRSCIPSVALALEATLVMPR